MVTRWTLLDPQGWDPEPEWATTPPWAFSVRPDLWGPGWEVDDPESEGWLVAEAMVLAGVVSARWYDAAYQPWVAVEAP